MKNPPEQFRLTAETANARGISAWLASTSAEGRNGFFLVPFQLQILRCLISDGEGWEHVSVSLKHRCPNWEEMCFVKSVFFDAEECVMQLHPPQSEWVNNHPNCLHLWRPVETAIPKPPQILVGIPGVTLK